MKQKIQLSSAAEQRPVKAKVVGSNPSAGANIISIVILI